MEEKCFCHFGGYKVKDADARAQIQKANGDIAACKAAQQNTDGNIELLNARVNQVTSIPEGSTADNVELLDIRVGHSETFPSAGTAVREQTKAAFQYGGFLTSGGLFFTDANEAPAQRQYLINGDVTADMCANLPWYGERYTLLCFHGYVSGAYKAQMAFGFKKCAARYQADQGWGPWQELTKDPCTIQGMGFTGSGLGYAFTDVNDAPQNSTYIINYPSKEELANSPFYGERLMLITIAADSESYGFGGIHNVQLGFGTESGKMAWRTKNNSYWNRWIYPGDASNKLYTIADRPYNFAGKTFKFFGDSIVDGCEVERSYKQIFCEKVGATYTSYAVGGASFVQRDDRSRVLQQLQSTPLDSDYIFLSAGINDRGLGVEMSELSTALDETFSYIANNFSGEVFVLTPINGNYDHVGELNDIRETITYKALYYGFNVLDGSSYGFPVMLTDDAERTHWYISGGVHPSQLGHEMIAKKLSYDLL